MAAMRSAMLAPTRGAAGEEVDEVEAECCTAVIEDVCEVGEVMELEAERVCVGGGCCFSSAFFSNMLSMLPNLPGLRAAESSVLDGSGELDVGDTSVMVRKAKSPNRSLCEYIDHDRSRCAAEGSARVQDTGIGLTMRGHVRTGV